MNTFAYLKQSVYFFRQHFKAIAAIQLPFLLLLNGLGFWLETNAAEGENLQRQAGFISLIGLALLPIYWGATILYMQSVLDQRPFKASQAIIASLSFWRTLLFTFILTAFAIMGGLMLLIIPGIYIGVRLAFADYICVLEKRGAIDSLKQSWEDSADYFWPLLQGLLILYPALQILEILFAHLFSSGETRNLLIELPIFVFIDLLSALITVFGFRIYCVMRQEIRP